MRCSLIIFIICLTLVSCEEQFGICENEPPKKILDISQQLFAGDITERSSTLEDNADVWKIRIENERGAIVSFYWQKNYNIIFKIVGERGPFDYDLEPPLNVLPLSTARFLAFESFSDEVLKCWTLKRNPAVVSRWIYEFLLNGYQSPVTLDAASGDLITY